MDFHPLQRLRREAHLVRLLLHLEHLILWVHLHRQWVLGSRLRWEAAPQHLVEVHHRTSHLEAQLATALDKHQQLLAVAVLLERLFRHSQQAALAPALATLPLLPLAQGLLRQAALEISPKRRLHRLPVSVHLHLQQVVRLHSVLRRPLEPQDAKLHRSTRQRPRRHSTFNIHW